MNQYCRSVSQATQQWRRAITTLLNVAPLQLGEKAPDVHGCFFSQSLRKAGSVRNESQIGSSFKKAGVMGAGA